MPLSAVMLLTMLQIQTTFTLGFIMTLLIP